MDLKIIQKAIEENKRRFGPSADWALEQMEKHIIELKKLQKAKSPHLPKEAIDMLILAGIFADNIGVTDKLIKERVNENLKKKK